METIREFFDDIKGRLSSPILGGFLISWIIFNWKIVIVLVFYKQEDLSLDNYVSYLDFINKHIDIWLNLILPFSAAFLYTFMFPHIKAYIKEYQAKVLSASESRILNITRD